MSIQLIQSHWRFVESAAKSEKNVHMKINKATSKHCINVSVSPPLCVALQKSSRGGKGFVTFFISSIVLWFNICSSNCAILPECRSGKLIDDATVHRFRLCITNIDFCKQFVMLEAKFASVSCFGQEERFGLISNELTVACSKCWGFAMYTSLWEWIAKYTTLIECDFPLRKSDGRLWRFSCSDATYYTFKMHFCGFHSCGLVSQ